MDKLFLKKNGKFEFTFYMQSNEMNTYSDDCLEWVVTCTKWMHVLQH